ncbi:MAG: amino acid permease [candidate division WOR-3 bacterium]
MRNSKLSKKLNFIEIFCVASGAMISSGIFILPGIAYLRAGPAVIISYFIAGCLALTGILSQAELVSAMPKAGGAYFYVTRSMGPLVGTVDGLLTWFSLSLKGAFALVGMAEFTSILVDLNIHFISISLCIIFIVLNIIGIKEAGRAQVVLVVFLLGVMILYITLGIPNIKVEHFRGFASKGFRAIFSTAGFVFVSYGGILKIASIAEEVKEPERIIPLAMIFSLLTIGTLYILMVLVTGGVLGNSLDNSLTPISDGASTFMGEWGRVLLSIAAIFAFISTANASIMSASRYPLAMSRDNLLPKILQQTNKKFCTPHLAILLTGTVMIISLFFPLDILIEAASIVLIMTYFLSSCAVIVMRQSGIGNYRPRFKSPIYPFPQITGLIGSAFFILEMGREAILIVIFLVAGALITYLIYGRSKRKEEFALLYLIERITAKELTSHSLENELKEIIRERDKIQKDRLDELIEKCSILDIKEKIDLNNFFKLVAEKLSPSIGIPKEKLYHLFIEREKESPTAINSDIAIPHIIIQGEKQFNILLARAKEGVNWGEEFPKVKAIFVLIGTKDERNFHLRVLTSIAQIVRESDFMDRWIRAKSIENLRDIILLGERKRGP